VRAQSAADGNPRLFEWLHTVLESSGLNVGQVVDEMARVEEQFREHILARHLIASLPEDARMLLGRLLFLTLPVPFAAVQALVPEMHESDVTLALDRASALSLLDVGRELDRVTYYVPRQLAGGDPPLLPELDEGVRPTVVGRCCDALYQAWWVNASSSTESERLEMIRLGLGERTGRDPRRRGSGSDVGLAGP
jgi:hypothetical protein